MPSGENLARCSTCGKTWIVGDCIPSTCPACVCAKEGHRRIGNFCGACGANLPEERIPWEDKKA